MELSSAIDLRNDLYRHLNSHKTDGEIVLPLLCIQTNNCLSRINSIRDYVNHFEDFHPIEEQVPREGYQNGDSDHEMPVDESENERVSLNDVEDIAEYDDNVVISIDDDSQ